MYDWIAVRPHVNPTLDSFTHVTATDVYRLLLKVLAKSLLLEVLPTSLQKVCADQFVVIITRLGNVSFCVERFQHVLRLQRSCRYWRSLAQVEQIHRSTSNLSSISKVLDRLTLAQVGYDHICWVCQLLSVPSWISYVSLYRNSAAAGAAKQCLCLIEPVTIDVVPLFTV